MITKWITLTLQPLQVHEQTENQHVFEDCQQTMSFHIFSSNLCFTFEFTRFENLAWTDAFKDTV